MEHLQQLDVVEALREHWYAGAALTCVVIVVLVLRASKKQSQAPPSGFGLKVALDRAHRVLLTSDDFGSPPPKQSPASPEDEIRSNNPWTAALSRETMSDLVRTITANTGSVFFAQHASPDGKQTQTQQIEFDPYVSTSTSGNANSALDEFQQRVIRAFRVETWTKLDTLQQHIVLQRVAWFLTIAPCLTVTLQTGLMPALFQPTFVIIISNEEDVPVVRVMVDAFIGGPPLGPPNPRLKYTPLRLRMLSSDLALIVEEGTDKVQVQLPSISYAIRKTKSKSMLETVKESSGALHGVLVDGAAWQTVVVA